MACYLAACGADDALQQLWLPRAAAQAQFQLEHVFP